MEVRYGSENLINQKSREVPCCPSLFHQRPSKGLSLHTPQIEQHVKSPSSSLLLSVRILASLWLIPVRLVAVLAP